MRRHEAEKAAKIIKEELDKMMVKYMWFKAPIVRLVESETVPGWWGVEIRTDGDSYDYFYDHFEMRTAGKLQQKVLDKVCRELNLPKEDHYFELIGGGVLHLF